MARLVWLDLGELRPVGLGAVSLWPFVQSAGLWVALVSRGDRCSALLVSGAGGLFGFGGVGVGFGFGNIGWVPLAPYEVMHPWWGRAYYGRPSYFNAAINGASINVIGAYRNAGVRNGFTAVSGEDFRAGRFQNFVRPSGEQLRQANAVSGPIPVRARSERTCASRTGR